MIFFSPLILLYRWCQNTFPILHDLHVLESKIDYILDDFPSFKNFYLIFIIIIVYLYFNLRYIYNIFINIFTDKELEI